MRRPQQPVLQGIDALRADFAAQAGGTKIYFGAGSAFLAPPAKATLGAQAAWLRRHPEVVVRIEGHGDSRRHARSCAGGRRRAAPRKRAIIWCCWASPRRRSRHELGQGAAGPRPRRHDHGARVRPRGAGSWSSPASARLALGFGDLAGGHFERDFGAAFLATGAARQSREIEPFVRFDEIDRDRRGRSMVTPSSNKASTSPASASARRLLTGIPRLLTNCPHFFSPQSLLRPIRPRTAKKWLTSLRPFQTAILSIRRVVPITAAAISRISPCGTSSGSSVAASTRAK